MCKFDKSGMVPGMHPTFAKPKDAELVQWVDAKRAFALFTLGRTTLSRLAREGKIRACSLAEEGMARGKKLYDAASIREYLNQRAAA